VVAGHPAPAAGVRGMVRWVSKNGYCSVDVVLVLEILQ